MALIKQGGKSKDLWVVVQSSMTVHSQLSLLHRDAQLFTVVIKNDNHNGVPVAFLLTTKSDSTIIADWFRMLATRMDGKFKPAVAITDQGSTEIKALNDAFPECKVFLCFWHVLKAWKTRLRAKGATDEEREKASVASRR